MRLLTLTIVLALTAAPDAGAAPSDALGAPVKNLAGGKPIDVEIGHAAPYLLDLDGDGKRDLLVGQFGGGRLRVFVNEGTDAKPRYGKWTYLKAGSEDARVPSG